MAASDTKTHVYSADWLLTADRHDRALEAHALVVRDRRIVAIQPVADALRRFPSADHTALPGQVLMPGLINAHTHLAMTLFRGLADDLPLADWLNGHVWPAEKQWLSDEFVHDGSLLAIAELLRGGVTCFADMYFFPDAVARAAAHAGIRALLHAPVLEFPTAWAAGPDEYIHKALALHDDFRGHPLISVGIGPHAPYTVSNDTFRRILMLTNELAVPMSLQTHVHETAAEVSDALAATGVRPLARLHALGMTGPSFQCVHMTTLDNEDIDTLVKTGTHVIHCPESNMKLASGACPVGKLLAAGVNVALGTDGAASNNDLDMFSEMRTAALLAKLTAGDPTAVPAATALRMATINGARALGIDAVTGSLEPGKSADFIAVSLAEPETQPVFDVLSQIVYATGRQQVTHTWVAGEALMTNRQLTTINAGLAVQRAQDWAARMKA
jgi:5-methylthioadenosine/S-adenosylhomocysteine deaminase